MSYINEKTLNGSVNEGFNNNIDEAMKKSTNKITNEILEKPINGSLDAIITLIKHLADSTDEFGRTEIQNALRETAYSMETPFQTTMRLSLDVGPPLK